MMQSVEAIVSNDIAVNSDAIVDYKHNSNPSTTNGEVTVRKKVAFGSDSDDEQDEDEELIVYMDESRLFNKHRNHYVQVVVNGDELPESPSSSTTSLENQT